MTVEPFEPPDLGTAPYGVIHLGGQAAVVVPMDDFLRMRALEQLATVEQTADAEDAVAIHHWREREAAGLNVYIPVEEARQRLGLDRTKDDEGTARGNDDVR